NQLDSGLSRHQGQAAGESHTAASKPWLCYRLLRHFDNPRLQPDLRFLAGAFFAAAGSRSTLLAAAFRAGLAAPSGALVCFILAVIASIKLMTCGSSPAGTATISFPWTLASINWVSFSVYTSRYWFRSNSAVVRALINWVASSTSCLLPSDSTSSS